MAVQEPTGPGIRCDSGIYSGLEITHHYDPILSKLIVWGENRPESLAKMKTALENYVILGVQTPLRFLQELMSHPEFINGNLHTGFLEQHFKDWQPVSEDDSLKMALLTAAAAANKKRRPAVSASKSEAVSTPWQSLGEWDMFN